jgi:polysaccharide pyruvyl transferase WcaK-like protein
MHIMIYGGAGAQNSGDEALLLSAVQICQRLVPCARITVAANNLEVAADTLRDHDVKFVLSPRVTFFQLDRHYWAADEVFQRRWKTIRETLLGRPLASCLNALQTSAALDFIDRSGSREFLQALAETDALVIHGGGVLTSATRSRLWELSLVAEVAASLGKRVLFRSHQLGPYNNSDDEDRIRSILQLSEFVSTRDLNQSKKEACRVFPRESVVDQVDDALILEMPRRYAERVLVDYNLQDGNFICVGYRDNPGVGTRDLAYSRMAKIVELAHDIFRSPVVLLPQGPFDLPSLMRLSSMLSVGAQLIEPKDPFCEPIAIASRARLMIGTPHHSLIFALRGGVPILSPVMGEYYSFKNIGSMRFFGLESFIVDITNEEHAYRLSREKLRFVHENEAQFRRFLMSRVVALRAKAHSQDYAFADHLLKGARRASGRRKITETFARAKSTLLAARSSLWRVQLKRGLY